MINKELIKSTPIKLSLITLVIALFGITFLPQFNILKWLLGGATLGWFTGKLVAQIWTK
jgi:hypothetical protein